MPLILTVGPPGAGKSTWAHETFGPSWLKLERDKLRQALFGSKKEYFGHSMSSKERSKVITLCAKQAVANWPQKKVVCSDSNLFWFTSQHIVRMFDMKAVKIVVFDIDEETYHERNKAREGTDDYVPAGDITSYWKEYKSELAWWRDWPHTTPEKFTL